MAHKAHGRLGIRAPRTRPGTAYAGIPAYADTSVREASLLLRLFSLHPIGRRFL
ncbi:MULTISPECIES: hypothetical protein [unclassified Streptomyces]|uniref:hypothetical protein n=1 Tax=unclassified Streptomyces TaxID=2593676 RepID=UPI001371F830|nr:MULTISPECIES: hypothetical protein [unclassified Streptomyces]MYZ33920.1 hypothetical protein [Streptomyces sp. SID4917]